MPYGIDGCSGEAVSRFTDKQWILSKHGQPLAILLGENADTSGFWDTLFSEKTMCQSQSQNLGKSPILGLGINPSIGICILIIRIHLQCQGLIFHPLHGNRSFNIWLRNHAQPIIISLYFGLLKWSKIQARFGTGPHWSDLSLSVLPRCRSYALIEFKEIAGRQRAMRKLPLGKVVGKPWMVV